MFFPSDIINEVKMAQFNSDESVFRKFIPFEFSIDSP